MSSPHLIEQADRTFRDVAASERQMRQQAEQTVHAFTRLLADVANHFAGQSIEAARTLDPAAPYNWSIERWSAFFTRYIFQARSTWGQSAALPAQDPNLEAEIRTLKAENNRLQKALEGYREFNQHSDAHPARPPSRPAVTQPEHQALPLQSTAGLPEAPTALSSSRETPISHADLMHTLNGWSAPIVPPAFAAKFREVSHERWTRQTITLYLLAVPGICARPEVEQLLALAGSVDRRTTAIRQAIDHLVQLGFISLHRLEMRQPLSTSLVALQLTADGLSLCKALSYEPIEQELLRYRRILCPESPSAPQAVERALSALAFALQSRYRGYKALLAPPPSGGIQADVAIERGMERYLVFTGSDADNLFTRWQTAQSAPVAAAVCALDEPTCAHLAARCKAAVRTGAAADLSLLVRQRQPTAATSLWAQVW